MTGMEAQRYVLAELEDFSPLSSPLKSSQRVKFTCFDASKSFIVIGATSGGIYIFQRKPCVYLQLIPNTEGAITQISISPNENMFAFSNVKGVVFLIDHNVGQVSAGSVRKVQVSNDHRGAEVTALQWNQKSNDLYIGDDKGKISVVSVSFFMAKSIFQAPSFILMELDSKVIQMDIFNNLLLVSTVTRSYICDTVQEQYKRIGSRPRDGAYGSCFQRVNNSNTSSNELDASDGQEVDDSQNVRIFCARPSLRLWEVTANGDVMSTHKFAEALAVPPTPLVAIKSQLPSTNKTVTQGFSKLFPIGDKFLFTYEHDTAYIIDPELAHIVLWSKLNGNKDITDARTIDNVVYLWSGSLLALTLLTLEDCLLCLFTAKRFQACIDLCLQHVDYLMRRAQSIIPISDLGKHVTSIPEEIMPLMDEVVRLAKKAEGRIRQPLRSVHVLESGIHVIGEGHEAMIERKGLRETRCGIAVVRSRSASPGSTLRKFGDRCNVLAKEISNKKGLSTRVGNVSLVCAEAPSSSLPDLMEATTEETPSSLKVAEEKNRDKIHVMPNNHSKSTQDSKSLAQNFIFKLPENRIREKWLELEGHIKSLRTDSVMEKCEAEEFESEIFADDYAGYESEIIVQTRNRLLQKSMPVPETKLLYPDLELESLFELAKLISSKEDMEEILIYKLFDFVLSAIDSFADKKQEESSSVAENNEGIPATSIDLGTSPSKKKLFPFRYYFDNDVIEVIVKSLEYLISSNLSSEWLVKKLDSGTNDEREIHPVLKKCYSPREIQDDLNFCAFIDLFKEIIDPMRTLSVLSESSSPCRFLVWSRLVELLMEKSNGRGEYKDKISHCSSLPATLPWLLLEFKRVAKGNCSKLLVEAPALLLKEKVPIRHCLYIIMWICTGNNEKDWQSSYLTILLSSGNSLQDSLIRKCAMDGFLEVNQRIHSKVLCHCGFPFVGAQVESLPYFASIGIRLAQHLWCSGKEIDCLKLCWNTGLWRWLVSFLHNGYSRKKGAGQGSFSVITNLHAPLGWNEGWWQFGILHVLATLGDKWSLQFWIDEMDMEAWNMFLKIRMNVLGGICLGCQTVGCCQRKRENEVISMGGLSWTDIGALMIESLGADTSCKLLMESNVMKDCGQLDRSFYKLCLLATLASSKVEGMSDSDLRVKSFLKRVSSKKQVFSPKVAQLIDSSLARDSSSWQNRGGNAVVPIPPSQPNIHNHHWGCVVSMGKGSSCNRCSLPVASPVLLSGSKGGLIVLPCGHLIHKVCTRSFGSRCPFNCPPVCIDADVIKDLGC